MRTFLYRKDFQDGKIFNEDQIADALHDGWVDDPSNITESSKAAEAARPDVGKPAKPKAAVTPKKDVLTMTVPVARVAIMKEKIRRGPPGDSGSRADPRARPEGRRHQRRGGADRRAGDVVDHGDQ